MALERHGPSGGRQNVHGLFLGSIKLNEIQWELVLASLLLELQEA